MFTTARLTHGLLLSIVLTFSRSAPHMRKRVVRNAQADEFSMNFEGVRLF
jgi:hypothetical protein